MHRRATVPARVNIIGEHTDYSGGLALPFAIDKYLTLDAIEQDEGYSGAVNVVELWKAAGGGPATLEVSSEIPMGQGLSSSAALCLAVVLCARGRIEPLEACKEAQRIEHEVLNTPCGLLDQMAMMYAIQGSATLIDFSNFSVESVDIPVDWVFKLVDSGIRRDLSSTTYSEQSNHQEIHIKEENERVRKAITASPQELGELLNQSHASLHLLGVSLPEMDAQVKLLQSTDGVLGARMMGGGFGGMILVLVENSEVLPGIEIVESSGPALIEEILES
jgi:galactokinase